MKTSRTLLALGVITSMIAGATLAQQEPTASPSTAPASKKPNAATVPATREGGFMDYHKQYVEAIKKGGIDIVFTGDSITFQWRNVGQAQWEKFYGSMKAANFGHSGDSTQHLLWRLQNGECDGPAPKVVVLMIGTNNMGGNTFTVEQVAEGITANVTELQKHWPTTKIMLMAITPSGGSTPDKRKKLDDVNKIIAKLDDKQHIFYFDLGPKYMDDKGAVSPSLINGLHPTAAGYEIWGTAMKTPLDNLLHDKDLDGKPIVADVPATAK